MFLTRKGRAKQRVRESLIQLAKQGRVLEPSISLAVPCAYISIPALDIPKRADAYIAAVETQETDKWCRCEWIIHPDDVTVPDNACRVCGGEKRLHPDNGHDFRGRRKRRGDQADDCPLHTKEGLIIYFFEWVFTRGKN